MMRLLEDPRARFPFMALGMFALLVGLCAGLQRLGLLVDVGHGSFAVLHGPLMVCGFLGTLISLERAVALGRSWAYTAPLFTGIGGLMLITGIQSSLPLAMITLGSLILFAIFVQVLRIQPQAFAVVMAIGSLTWLIGNVRWLAGQAVYDVAWWWMGFLILTIAGERLELSRMLRHAPRVQALFLGLVAGLLVALVVTAFDVDLGVRLLGLLLVPLAFWLLRYDVARHTIRQQGLTRFIAACLLAGYVWLVVGGALMLANGSQIGGAAYDAMLHAVFVGFVFSMIFGHAPIIFPSVLGVPVAFGRFFYVHLSLLHASLIVRLLGDVIMDVGLRRLGSAGNAVAVLLFLATTVVSVIRERRMARDSEVVARG